MGQQGATTTSRPLRADAARNREKLLSAARVMFDEQGTDASLEEIARRAGVGVGTLYRNFPTRIELIEAVYRHNVDELCASGARLADSLEPRAAFEAWLLEFVAYAGSKRGLAGALRAALGDDASHVFADVHDRLTSSGDLMLHAAQADGTIRDDVETMDVLRAVSGVCMAAPDWRDPAKTQRALRIVLDGLRYRPAD
ncbi:TetR/AcrR family transcriptional regulator [Cellulomonas sp. PhB150]|uniref:TetR/AcrR family transcriptional regulator n=1 Tax=Cellulomonas sp. PhB150 TaxID=2485188 RepID=UPI000FB75260|nr:TetR/AcrR family transcriptional regulator [Cellulomonas sp. PhB150]ROS26174.1 TetR family transcriptional regulator [Cellulomonas sp. PhB150]